ncbi:hypothetical protein [Mycetocola spongiae]|uniref:hypothetical protein n=1 Tax=Mycetocola spongiae TaxID=2859226 RepID=UPI001CF4212A|nr:hypothetical protein [Mycetocola spongiae]UCR88687.1 hypothetical protein KXZ72_12080 [Mycetocola spongiae]
MSQPNSDPTPSATTDLVVAAVEADNARLASLIADWSEMRERFFALGEHFISVEVAADLAEDPESEFDRPFTAEEERMIAVLEKRERLTRSLLGEAARWITEDNYDEATEGATEDDLEDLEDDDDEDIPEELHELLENIGEGNEDLIEAAARIDAQRDLYAALASHNEGAWARAEAARNDDDEFIAIPGLVRIWETMEASEEALRGLLVRSAEWFEDDVRDRTMYADIRRDED